MYKLVPLKKSQKVIQHDYEFKDFKSFYDLARNITVPMKGRYSIAIVCEKLDDIKEFISVESRYSMLMIYVYAPQSLIDYMSLYNPALVVEDKISPYDTFVEMIADRKLLFDKDVIRTLYSSIDHDYDSMDAALLLIENEFGQQTLIKEKMLSELFILNKTVYPRQVMIAYLKMDRYRLHKLNKCINEMGNDVAIGAFVKNLKLLVAEKATFYKTGKCKEYVKHLNTRNINLMYRIIVTDRNGMNDLCLLLELYERGISSYDIVQETTY